MTHIIVTQTGDNILRRYRVGNKTLWLYPHQVRELWEQHEKKVVVPPFHARSQPTTGFWIREAPPDPERERLKMENQRLTQDVARLNRDISMLKASIRLRDAKIVELAQRLEESLMATPEWDWSKL